MSRLKMMLLAISSLTAVHIIAQEKEGKVKRHIAGQIYLEIGDFNKFQIKEGDGGFLHFEPNNDYNNTFFGVAAGVKNSSTIGGNSFFGYDAGAENIGGEENTLFGWRAGMNNQSGRGNTFLGSRAGESMTASSNTFVGYRAGVTQSSGEDNLFLGFFSGASRTGGSNNILIGAYAGANTFSGSRNILIGSNTGINESGSDRLYIDNNHVGSEPLIYGDFATDELTIHGQLGINKKEPVSELHLFHASTNGGGSTGLRLENSGANTNWWNFYTVNSNGNLLLFSKAGGASNVGSFNDMSGIYTPTSDRRTKKNFEELYDVLNRVNLLKTKRYHFKRQSNVDKKTIGLVAQEVLEVFPELVSYNEEMDLYGLDYATLSVVAIKAIQEQTSKIDQLERELEEIHDQIKVMQQILATTVTSLNNRAPLMQKVVSSQ